MTADLVRVDRRYIVTHDRMSPRRAAVGYALPRGVTAPRTPGAVPVRGPRGSHEYGPPPVPLLHPVESPIFHRALDQDSSVGSAETTEIGRNTPLPIHL